MSGLRVYGVVRAGTKTPPNTDTVEYGDIAAVVGDMTGPELTDSEATDHLDVLCALVTTGPVVPLRFGTVAPDAEAVCTEVLAPAHDNFVAMLESLHGMVELRVVVAFDEQQMLRDALAGNAELRGAAGGRGLADQMAIGEMAVRELTERVHAEGERLLAPVCEIAKASQRVEPPEPATDVWALLVAADDLSTVDQQVAKLAAQSDAEINYFGPLPALTFAGAAAPPPQRQGSAWGW